MTVGDLIEEIAARFETAGLVFGHGYDSAWDEAVALVLHVGGLPDDRRVLADVLAAGSVARIEALAGRREQERVPLAYLLGRCRFAGHEFLIEPGIVIPRSPIGALIRQRFSPWLREPPARILDLCCGSGCIGIAAGLAFPDAVVDLADLDPGAVDLARRNVALHVERERAVGATSCARPASAKPNEVRSRSRTQAPLRDREVAPTEERQVAPTDQGQVAPADQHQVPPMRVFLSDLFDDLPLGQWDLILSNPPYVDRADMSSLPPEYRHEPRLGLAGGDDGLDLVARMLDALPQRLAPGGTFVCEVGASAPALRERYPELPLLWPDLPEGGEGVFILQP